MVGVTYILKLSSFYPGALFAEGRGGVVRGTVGGRGRIFIMGADIASKIIDIVVGTAIDTPEMVQAWQGGSIFFVSGLLAMNTRYS